MEHNCCDICGNPSIYQDYFVSEPWRSTKPIRYCRECELYYLSERPELDEIVGHYKKYYKMSLIAHLIKLFVSKARVQFQSRFINHNIGAVEGNALEIGSPNGNLIRNCLINGGKVSVDFSLQSDVVRKDIECFSNIDKLNSQKFDFIAASHVVEHFLNPVHDMSHLLDLLRIGGFIFIEVPMSPNYSERPSVIRRYLNTDHMVNFSVKSLIKFLELFSLTIFSEQIYEINLKCLHNRIDEKKIIAQIITEGVGDPYKKCDAFLTLARLFVKNKLFTETKNTDFVFGKNIQIIAKKIA